MSPCQYPADLFAGAASYYARFRVPYPQNLFDDLRKRAGLTGNGRLLDLACGTGEVALPLHAFFSEVLAVDQEDEMIQVGRQKAQVSGATNVQWITGRAEDIQVPPESFELITIGSAFHRLDRPLVAKLALQLLKPCCCMADMGCYAAWRGTEAWQKAAAEVIAEWTGESNRAPETQRQMTPSHEEVLAAAGFVDIEKHRFPTRHVWTADSFIGYLRSTGRIGHLARGDQAGQFETDMRQALQACNADGRFPELIDFYYILGRRPS